MAFLLGFFGFPLLYLVLVNLTEGALKDLARDPQPAPPMPAPRAGPPGIPRGAANVRIPGLEDGLPRWLTTGA